MTWLVLIAVGAGSYVLRVGPLLVLERSRPSPAVEQGIRHGGLAAIAALVALSTADVAASGGAVPALAAAGTAAVLAARGTSLLRLLLIGSACFAVATIAGEVLA
jgi:branched-subunit amino acid transport protein